MASSASVAAESPLSKKPKLTQQPSAFASPSRPRPPRQTQISNFIGSSPASKKTKPSSTTRRPGNKKSQNASILSFFKPIPKKDPNGGALFLGDEAFDSDDSDCEMDDTEMEIAGREATDNAYSPATEMSLDISNMDTKAVEMAEKRGLKEKESESKVSSPAPGITNSTLPPPSAPKFDPSTLKLNLSSSTLFANATAKRNATGSFTTITTATDYTCKETMAKEPMAPASTTKVVDPKPPSVSNTQATRPGPQIAKATPKGNALNPEPKPAKKRKWGEIDDEDWVDLDEEEDDVSNGKANQRSKKLEKDDDKKIVMKPPQLPKAWRKKCPLCDAILEGLKPLELNAHINKCREDREPKAGTPVSTPRAAPREHSSNILNTPKTVPQRKTAGKAQPKGWKSASKAGERSGAEERTCPFYKILFDGSVTVDAFRYGRVPLCNAYFLSHFHSDHYMGLNAKWNHGIIYCSTPTANLIRTQLKVPAKWVVELPLEEWVNIPCTYGVRVRGIDANHCPGSMMFLFEKTEGAKTTRILHCGDFRADKKHLDHPLLRPGPDHKQKLDTVYLDTTYLNPKYNFPSQQSVIDACAEACVSWNNARSEAGPLDSFVTASRPVAKKPRKRRLLVLVGTYALGKERLAVGIAKALNTQIYAPPDKLAAFRQLEDRPLVRLCTTQPWAAQVHLTSLGAINNRTVAAYLEKHPTFTHIVGIRPSGWNFAPPAPRLLRNTQMDDILYSSSWKSEYTSLDVLGKSSDAVARCVPVPYSEHSSFRELCLFMCGLAVDRVIPTVGVGSKENREEMKVWFGMWEEVRRKGGVRWKEEDEGEGAEW